MNEFLCCAGEPLAQMKLVVEGAVHVFETEGAPLFALRKGQSGELNDSVYTAYDTVGVALYFLQGAIGELSRLHAQEIRREIDNG